MNGGKEVSMNTRFFEREGNSCMLSIEMISDLMCWQQGELALDPIR
ncbi:hypothetical protein COLO4_38095 [Corchorus olitorius]|uniref:Uncharacterized protein n=1 Tax=Corchorus olitorius TaxID=93759 RepID=A0A1R3FX09_9ROSI|nr:hypothetical protein COLO4_38095 [Corchorus olitorius]